MEEKNPSEKIQNSSFCLKPINSSSTINRYPELNISDCDSTSIIITSEVDSEIQIAAQRNTSAIGLQKLLLGYA